MGTPKQTRIKATPERTLDLTSLVPSVCEEFGFKRNSQLINFLNALTIDRRRFRFVYRDHCWQKVYVICEGCKKPRLKLHRLDGVYLCAEQGCHGLAHPARLRRRNAFYSKIIRPLRILGELNDRIFNDDLTPLQLRRLCEKAERLRGIIPQYALSLKSEAEKLAKVTQKSSDFY